MRQNKLSSKAKVAILLVIIIVPSLFAAAAVGTSKLFTAAPIAVVAALLVASGIYTGYASARLYRFFGSSQPWYSYLPCFGEVSLLDGVFFTPCLALYIFAILAFAASHLPYSVLSAISPDFAFAAPFWLTVLCFVLLLALQIVKGIGLTRTMKAVSTVWEERMHTSLGLLNASILLNFIPFVRIISVYCLAKPLSTMVDFNHMSSAEDDDIVLSENN